MKISDIATLEEGPMEQGTNSRRPSADVDNAYSWLAVGVAIGSSLGVALDRIALGVGLGLALGALGAILSKRGKIDKSDEN
jgi:hypothetical protein